LFENISVAKQHEALKMELKVLKAQLALERRRNGDNELPDDHPTRVAIKQHLNEMNALVGPKGQRKYGSSAQAGEGSQRQSSSSATSSGSAQSAKPEVPPTLSA